MQDIFDELEVGGAKDDENIRGSSKGSKRVKFERRAQYPEMEAKLYSEYKNCEGRD